MQLERDATVPDCAHLHRRVGVGRRDHYNRSAVCGERNVRLLDRVVTQLLGEAMIGVRPRIDLAALGRGAHAKDAAGARVGEREVWFDGGTPIYAREKLPLEKEITGPAIVEQLDCTTVLEPGCRARLDAHGNLLVEV